MTSFSEINSQLTPPNEVTGSNYAIRVKEHQRLASLYDQYYGQVTNRSHDLGQLQSKLETSQKRLHQLTVTLRDANPALDLDAKMSQCDDLKVALNVSI